MIGAGRASSLGQSAEPVSLWSIIRHRQIPTGATSDHFATGPLPTVDDQLLARYQCPEHVSVPLSLMSSHGVRPQDWQGRRIALIGSDGDAIAPPARIRSAATRLRSWGAMVTTDILAGGLPHMFPLVQEGADRIADIVAEQAR